ncbi:MAG: hypothetical protein ACK5SZ_01960, partial [bacterium]
DRRMARAASEIQHVHARLNSRALPQLVRGITPESVLEAKTDRFVGVRAEHIFRTVGDRSV